MLIAASARCASQDELCHFTIAVDLVFCAKPGVSANALLAIWLPCHCADRMHADISAADCLMQAASATCPSTACISHGLLYCWCVLLLLPLLQPHTQELQNQAAGGK
jgi:hypothetical protein